MRFNIEKSKEEQIRLAKKIVKTDEFDELKLVAGADFAFFENKIISAISVCEFPSMKLVEKQTAVADAVMPYIPGLEGYRESPAAAEAFLKLKNKPDLLIVDGHGISHPRKLGLASHLGLILDIPSIGVAEKLMSGKIEGDYVIIDNEKRGVLMQTKEHAKPLILSTGHKVSLKTAKEIISKTIVYPHKLPEPVHLAHKFADKKRKELISSV